MSLTKCSNIEGIKTETVQENPYPLATDNNNSINEKQENPYPLATDDNNSIDAKQENSDVCGKTETKTDKTTKKVSGKTVATRKRYQHRKEHFLNPYNKKQILSYFDEHGCSEKSFEDAIKSFKINKSAAQDYFNKHIENTEKNVSDECSSLSFENNDKWLEFYKKLNLDQTCKYEQAGIITLIAKNEEFPPPDELGGVNLKACYEFLGKALYGLPQPDPDPVTTAFLSREFELLINAANEDSATAEVLEMKTKLSNINEVNKKSVFSSLDPLKLEDSQ